MFWTARQPFRALLVCTLFAGGCNWLSLAKNAFTYESIQRGETGNLVAADSFIYASRAEDGLAVVHAGSGQLIASLTPPAGSESIDDLAIDGTLLFALDARPPGHLSIYTLENPRHPRLAAEPREVPVGPFSGISASRGLCIVSGGTSLLTAWRYDSAGALHGPTATADLGRGQPDALVDSYGRTYVSTHYWGPYFGLDILRYDSASRTLSVTAKLKIDGAGFTSGGAKPANFPIEGAALGRDSLLLAYARGVAVVNTSRLAEPAITQLVDVGGPAVNVDALGTMAAVAVTGAMPSVVLLDFAGAAVRIVRRIPLAPGTLPTGVALTAATVAVAARDRGVLIFPR